jgi:acyl-CoA reductase-like NAD-dependent aldehyde dehydrogenase
MPIAAVNPFDGKTIEASQPFTAGQLDWKLGTDVGPLAMARSFKSLHDDVRKSVDAGRRLLTRGSPLDRSGVFMHQPS